MQYFNLVAFLQLGLGLGGAAISGRNVDTMFVIDALEFCFSG